MAGRYFTDPYLARRMVEWAGPLDGFHILEPSCGDGVIVKCLPKTITSVTAVETDVRMAAKVRALSKSPRLVVEVGDFLALGMGSFGGERARACSGPWDVCLANPPYEGGNDVAHTAAMLKVSRRVIVLLRSCLLHSVSFNSDVLSKAVLRRIAFMLGRPVFHGPDDKGDGARHEYVVLDLSPTWALAAVGAYSHPTIEWWPGRAPRKKKS